MGGTCRPEGTAVCPSTARLRGLAIARETKLRVRMADCLERRKKGIPPDLTVTTHVAPTHDARLPLAGTLLVKEFKGRTNVVRMLDTGFEFDGRQFSSLSAIAQECGCLIYRKHAKTLSGSAKTLAKANWSDCPFSMVTLFSNPLQRS